MKLMLVALCAVLTGCGQIYDATVDMEQDANERNYKRWQAIFQETCESYGFEKGTEKFGDCMMQQQQNSKTTKTICTKNGDILNCTTK